MENPFRGIFGKRRKSEMTLDQNVLDKLELLTRVEQRIARFYHLCAEVRPQERAFWRKMAEGERRHVEYLHRMREIYCRHPHQFQSDHPFEIAAIRLFDLSLRELPRRERLQGLERGELMEIVEKIENSAVEMNYGKVIRSDNVDFSRLAARLEAESQEHRRTLAEMAAG